MILKWVILHNEYFYFRYFKYILITLSYFYSVTQFYLFKYLNSSSTAQPTICSGSCLGEIYSFWLPPFTQSELTSLTVCLVQHFVLVGTGRPDQTEHDHQQR